MVQPIERQEAEKIFVVMENGKIQKVLSDNDTEIVLVNYDTTVEDPSGLMEIEGRKVFVQSKSTSLGAKKNKEEVEVMKKAFTKEIEKRKSRKHKSSSQPSFKTEEPETAIEVPDTANQVHHALEVSTAIIKTAIKLGMPVTHIHVQKMMYVLQGTYLADYGRPLFEGDIARWVLGPVIPAVHRNYIIFGMSPISFVPKIEDVELEELNSVDENMIEKVVKMYAKEDVYAFINQTKQHRIYMADELNTLYTDEELKSFFRNEYERKEG